MEEDLAMLCKAVVTHAADRFDGGAGMPVANDLRTAAWVSVPCDASSLHGLQFGFATAHLLRSGCA